MKGEEYMYMDVGKYDTQLRRRRRKIEHFDLYFRLGWHKVGFSEKERCQ